MKLGKDFAFIARIVMAVLKALLQLGEKLNDDTPGNGDDIQ